VLAFAVYQVPKGNEALIIAGAGSKGDNRPTSNDEHAPVVENTMNFKVVTSGGSIVLPVLQRAQRLSLESRTVDPAKEVAAHIAGSDGNRTPKAKPAAPPRLKQAASLARRPTPPARGAQAPRCRCRTRAGRIRFAIPPGHVVQRAGRGGSFVAREQLAAVAVSAGPGPGLAHVI